MSWPCYRVGDRVRLADKWRQDDTTEEICGRVVLGNDQGRSDRLRVQWDRTPRYSREQHCYEIERLSGLDLMLDLMLELI